MAAPAMVIFLASFVLWRVIAVDGDLEVVTAVAPVAPDALRLEGRAAVAVGVDDGAAPVLADGAAGSGPELLAVVVAGVVQRGVGGRVGDAHVDRVAVRGGAAADRLVRTLADPHRHGRRRDRGRGSAGGRALLARGVNDV